MGKVLLCLVSRDEGEPTASDFRMLVSLCVTGLFIALVSGTVVHMPSLHAALVTGMYRTGPYICTVKQCISYYCACPTACVDVCIAYISDGKKWKPSLVLCSEL